MWTGEGLPHIVSKGCLRSHCILVVLIASYKILDRIYVVTKKPTTRNVRFNFHVETRAPP